MLDLQVLVIASSSILVVTGDVQLQASLDRDVLVAWGVTSSDLRTFLQRDQYDSMNEDKVQYVLQYRGQWRGDGLASPLRKHEHCR
jgi:hypothetical protein